MSNDLATEKADAIWSPKVGETWHYIDKDGRVKDAVWSGDSFDQRCLACGNCYPTRQLVETQTEVERLARLVTQLKAAGYFMLGSTIGVPLDKMRELENATVEMWKPFVQGEQDK